jgi:hypothetical protein
MVGIPKAELEKILLKSEYENVEVWSFPSHDALFYHLNGSDGRNIGTWRSVQIPEGVLCVAQKEGFNDYPGGPYFGVYNSKNNSFTNSDPRHDSNGKYDHYKTSWTDKKLQDYYLGKHRETKIQKIFKNIRDIFS